MSSWDEAKHEALRRMMRAGAMSPMDELTHILEPLFAAIPGGEAALKDWVEGRAVLVPALADCPVCQGSGRMRHGYKKCPTCDGEGLVAASPAVPDGGG